MENVLMVSAMAQRDRAMLLVPRISGGAVSAPICAVQPWVKAGSIARVCTCMTDHGLGRVWAGWRIGGRRRHVIAALLTCATLSASCLTARACRSPVGENVRNNEGTAGSVLADACTLTLLKTCVILVGADWVYGDVSHVPKA